MQEATARFVLGLLVGEGCFRIALRKEKRNRHNVQIYAEVQVLMHDRDLELLEHLCEKTGWGDIRTSPESNRVRWTIRSKDDIKEVIEFIEKHSGKPFKISDKGKKYRQWKTTTERMYRMPREKSIGQVKSLVMASKSLNDGGRGRSTEKWLKIVEGEE